MNESLMQVLKLFSLPTCGGHTVFLDSDSQGNRYIYRSNLYQKQDVFLYDSSSGETECITRDEPSSNRAYCSPDGRFICYAKDDSGNELFTFRIYDTESKQVSDLPTEACYTYLFAVDWKSDSSGFIRSCSRNDKNLIELINIQERTVKGLFSWKDPLMSATISRDGSWLACTAYDGDSYIVLVPLNNPENYRLIRPEGSRYNASPVWVDEGDRIFFVSDQNGYYQPAVYSCIANSTVHIELEIGEEMLSYSQVAPLAQVDRRNQIVYCLVTKDATNYVKKISLADNKAASINFGNFNTHAISLRDSDNLGIILSSMNTPQSVYLYSLPGQQLKQISKSIDDEGLRTLSDAESLEFESCDGTRVQGWYLAATDNRIGKKPALIIAHGGPREHFSNDWFNGLYFQVFARLGINIFAVNFRGSTSFGNEFLRKNIGDIGNGDVWDMAAAAEMLVMKKNVDSTRIGVMGASYGGYLSLMTLARRSDLFRCGISMIPPVDWAYQYGVSNSRFQNIIKYLHDGTPQEKPEAYEKSNVLNYSEGIKSALLVIASTNDFRCPIEPIYELQKKLESRGITADFAIRQLGHEGMFESVNDQMADMMKMVGFLTEQFDLKE